MQYLCTNMHQPQFKNSFSNDFKIGVWVITVIDKIRYYFFAARLDAFVV